MRIIPINFTEQQYKLLIEEKKHTGCSMGSIIRMMITRHFNQQEAVK